MDRITYGWEKYCNWTFFQVRFYNSLQLLPPLIRINMHEIVKLLSKVMVQFCPGRLSVLEYVIRFPSIASDASFIDTIELWSTRTFPSNKVFGVFFFSKSTDNNERENRTFILSNNYLVFTKNIYIMIFEDVHCNFL